MKKDRIAKRLEELTVLGGGVLTPNAVVDDAKDARSVLHEVFEWDDSKAAHAHRLEQARALIRSIRVEITIESRIVNCVGYVRAPDVEPEEQGYRATGNVRDDADLARDALRHEMARALAAMRRARELSLVFGLTDELEALIDGAEAVSLAASGAEHRAH